MGVGQSIGIVRGRPHGAHRLLCEGSPCTRCGAERIEGLVQFCPFQGGARKQSDTVVKTPCSTCKEPGLLDKWKGYRAAKKTWKAAGKPVRSQERVNELLAICQACPQLKDAGTDKQRCGVCGCPVNGRIDKPLSNKLAMATETQCPDTPARWSDPLATKDANDGQ